MWSIANCNATEHWFVSNVLFKFLRKVSRITFSGINAIPCRCILIPIGSFFIVNLHSGPTGYRVRACIKSKCTRHGFGEQCVHLKKGNLPEPVECLNASLLPNQYSILTNEKKNTENRYCAAWTKGKRHKLHEAKMQRRESKFSSSRK